MIKKRPPLAVIAGPTASGKSALAVALAERTGGVLVNADSAQVYQDLNILSAAPTARELHRAEHRLYGVVDGALPCSAADWAAMARREIADVHASGRMPILVGGTGLYLRTLLDGIAPIPAIDAAIRQEVRSAATAENRGRLERLDPASAQKIKANDIVRTARALEVALSTGRTLGEWQDRREGGIGADVNLMPMILLPPRAWLYPRCDERFVQMVEEGALDEVRALLARKLDRDLPVMRAIGVSELAAHLEDHSSLKEAVAAGQQATRRYAKRQYTWFANQPPTDWPRMAEPIEAARVESALNELLGQPTS